jgi:hypothetical protein
LGEGSSVLFNQNVALKEKKANTNETFNDRIISDENKNISLYSHYLKTIKTQYIH